MSTYNNRKDESGFTIIELMIASGIAILVVGLVYHVFFMSIKLNRRWQEKNHLESTSLMIMHRISKDIMQASDIIQLDENEIRIPTLDNQMITWTSQDSLLMRNKVLFNMSVFEKIGLSVKRVTVAEKQELMALDFQNNKRYENLDEKLANAQLYDIQLVLTSKRHHSYLENTVAVRNHSQLRQFNQ